MQFKKLIVWHDTNNLLAIASTAAGRHLLNGFPKDTLVKKG